MSAADPKDTVYIDVDEEITGIVSKVQNSNKNIVALVLPKRAAVLQSIVNMKLLKRASDQNDKQVVLITSEARLLPLAGAAKLFVAPNLTSKPYIPPAPALNEQTPSTEPENVAIDPKTPVSEVAPNAKYADDEPLEIDNTAPRANDAKPTPAGKSSKKGNKKQKIPNFNSFRKKAIAIALIAIILISGVIYALAFAPKAKIILKTQAKELPVQFDFIADPNSDEFDQENKIVPAQTKSVEKNDSEKVQTTGERDEGKKASGTITLRNCGKTSAGARTIPAGSGVSSGGNTFITQTTVTLPASIYSEPPTSACITPDKTVSVVAEEAGDQYNLSARDYTVTSSPDVRATGSDMSGGSSKKVKIVSQKDIDTAKERLTSKQNSVQDELKKQFEDEGFVAVGATFKASAANYNPSPGVNSEATEVTVSVTTKYTMLGVKKDDLRKLVEEQVKQDEGAKQQTLLKDGIDKADFKVVEGANKTSPDQIGLNFNSTVVVGPDINQDELKAKLAGKKKNESQELLKSQPGVLDPTVELSPFWVSSIPGKASRVTFEIQQADGTSIDQ